MTYYIYFVLTIISLSIASITGLISFKKINKRYQPFICYIFYLLFCEIIDHFLAIEIKNNIIVYNISILFETFILLYQFWIWNTFSQKKIIYLTVIVSLISIWVLDMHRNHNFTTYPN